MKSVKHIAYDAHKQSSEERQANFSAKLLTGVVTITLFTVTFLQFSDPLAMPQKASIEQNPVKPIDNVATPLKKEPRWVIMTISPGAWKIHLEQPQPVIEKVREEKPIEVKPKEKLKPEKKKTQPRKSVTKSVGSAKQAAATTGSGQNTNDMSNALAQIVQVIEEHKRYPKRARDIGMEGSTVLVVSIDSNGQVIDYRLRDGGNALFRRATLSAAQHLTGLKTQIRRAATLEIPVRYEID